MVKRMLSVHTYTPHGEREWREPLKETETHRRKERVRSSVWERQSKTTDRQRGRKSEKERARCTEVQGNVLDEADST